MVLSGPITLSTEEWLMSLSCQRATFSRAAKAFALMIRDSPMRFSDPIGFLLWGMAEDTFCPSLKGSSASATSVLCRWRISRAIFSTLEAIRARVTKYSAWRSRWMIWLEMGAGWRPHFLQTYASTAGERWAYVPTAPEIFP